MTLQHLSFDALPATWNGIEPVALAWFPHLSGCHESRFLLAEARVLLRAFVLHVRARRFGLAEMQAVRDLIDLECDQPGSVYDGIRARGIPEATAAVDRAAAGRGSWYGDTLAVLKCNITNELASDALRRWPVPLAMRRAAVG